MPTPVRRGSGLRVASRAKIARGSVASAARGGGVPHNKDAVKSKRSDTMSAKPAARKDTFGSRHNADAQKKAQRKMGRQSGFANTSFRESGQDERPATGKRNRRDTATKRGRSQGSQSSSAGRRRRGG